MSSIDERLQKHETLREKAIEKRKRIEDDLKRIEEKISYHNVAIHNLREKKEQAQRSRK